MLIGHYIKIRLNELKYNVKQIEKREKVLGLSEFVCFPGNVVSPHSPKKTNVRL